MPIHLTLSVAAFPHNGRVEWHSKDRVAPQSLNIYYRALYKTSLLAPAPSHYSKHPAFTRGHCSHKIILGGGAKQ